MNTFAIALDPDGEYEATLTGRDIAAIFSLAEAMEGVAGRNEGDSQIGDFAKQVEHLKQIVTLGVIKQHVGGSDNRQALPDLGPIIEVLRHMAKTMSESDNVAEQLQRDPSPLIVCELAADLAEFLKTVAFAFAARCNGRDENELALAACAVVLSCATAYSNRLSNEEIKEAVIKAAEEAHIMSKLAYEANEQA